MFTLFTRVTLTLKQRLGKCVNPSCLTKKHHPQFLEKKADPESLF